MHKRTVVISVTPGQGFSSGGLGTGWRTTFEPAYLRNVDSLVEKLRAKANALSSYLYERMDPATKECVDSYQPPSGDSDWLRVVLADYLNKVISGDCVYDPTRFKNVRLGPETKRFLSHKPQGEDLIRLNRMLLEEVYPLELWERWIWQPNAEICHPSHGYQVDRYEIIYPNLYPNAGPEVAHQISLLSPSTLVKPHKFELEDTSDLFDFDKVYLALKDWASGYPWDGDHERYLVEMFTGSPDQMLSLVALVQSHDIPGTLFSAHPLDFCPHLNLSKKEVRLLNFSFHMYDDCPAIGYGGEINAVWKLKMGIKTRNPRYNQIIEEIERDVLDSKKTILLLGPTGAGKSKLAKRIFDLRKERGLVGDNYQPVSCATLCGDSLMVMSALFGHVKGAFTGALKNRDGYVRKANNGLLFLDEIGTLGVEVQAMLLQALETGQFRPVGSDKEEESNFQLIAATNSDLKAAVRKGTFREDLWTRIRTWSYELLGVRDRPEDIKPNLDYELKQWEEENGKLLRMNKDVKAKFLSFATSPDAKWTGNFRDLRDIVERMARLSESGFITSGVLENEINRLKQLWAREEEPGEGSDAMLRPLLEEDRLAKVDVITD
jgi:transcriptional regulatory protein RtcR